MKTHLKFEVITTKPKTKVYGVYSTEDNSFLGKIRWHGTWRQYIFHTENTIWSDGCLKELFDFMQELRAARKKQKISLNTHTY